MSVAVQSSVDWQTGFLAVLPAVKTHAEIQFRRLPVLRREEAIAEAIASACLSYQRLAAQGRLHVAHPGTLADYAVRYVRSGRHVGGKQDAARDVMSPVVHRRHGVRVVSYDLKRSGEGDDSWRQMALASRKADIPELAAFRVDFAEWLRTLNRRDRRLVNRLACGDRTMDVAESFGLSAGRVSQLRHRYERAWKVFQGEGSAGQQAA